MILSRKKTVLILIALVHTRTVPWLKMTLSKWRWDAAEKMQVLSFVWPWWINSVRCYLLLVISKINCVPFYTLAFILFLLQLEDMLDKELLQRFISVINAQLLEGVRLETLKPKDIQQANCITQTWIAFSFLLAILAPWYCRIDLVNNPRKQSTIDAWNVKIACLWIFSLAWEHLSTIRAFKLMRWFILRIVTRLENDEAGVTHTQEHRSVVRPR